jgi:internalin A
MKEQKNFTTIANRIISDLTKYTVQSFKQSYPGYYYSAKEAHQHRLCNVEDMLNLLSDFRERQSIEYVIDRLKSDKPFSQDDTYILELFVKVINKIVAINNFINNFSTNSLKRESTTIFELLNLIRTCSTLGELLPQIHFRKTLKQHIPSFFSVIKHLENPNNYPIQYKLWTSITNQILSIDKDYDSLCKYYRSFPSAERHLEFGCFITGIVTIFIDRLKSELKIHSIHSSDYKKLTKIVTLPEFSLQVISVDPKLEYAKTLIANNLESKSLKLDLGNCGITDLSLLDNLFKCYHLEELTLSNEWSILSKEGIFLATSANIGIANTIIYIPNRFSLLTNLKVLRISGDWKNPNSAYWNKWTLSNLGFLKGLTKLEHLNASNNQISEIDALKSLRNLKELHLNNNKVKNIECLVNLRKIEQLFLSNNNISALPKLIWSENINTLDLHSNQIKNLFGVRNLIENMDIVNSKWQPNAISIANNPLEIPRMEVVNRGSENVITFFNQLDSEKEIKLPSFRNKEIKLVVVGNSNVGKSSFIKWLVERKIQKDIPTTHWLETKDWVADASNQRYAVKIFDFGGQEYYHDTHHLFFSNQAAYIVLWEPKTNILDDVRIHQRQRDKTVNEVTIQAFPIIYWLATIKYYTENRKLDQVEEQIKNIFDKKDMSIANDLIAPAEIDDKAIDNVSETNLKSDQHPNILIVQNKVDKQHDKAFLQQLDLSKEYPRIYDFQTISVHNNYRLHTLEKTLEELLSTLPILNSELPGTWQIIRERLESYPMELGNEVSFDEFHLYCNNILRQALKERDFSTNQIKRVLFGENDTRTFAEYLSDIGILLYFSQNQQLKNKVYVKPSNVIKSIYDVLLGLESTGGQFDEQHVARSLDKNHFDNDCADIVVLMKHFKIIINKPGSKDTFVAPLYLPRDPDPGIGLFINVLNKPVVRFFYRKYIHKTIILEFFHEYGSNALENTVGKDFYYWRNGILLKDSISDEIVLVSFNNKINSGDGSYIDIHCLSIENGKDFLNRLIDNFEKISLGWEYEKLVTCDGIDFLPLSLIKKNESSKSWRFVFNNKTYNLLDFRDYLSKSLKMKKLFISYSKSDGASLQKLENHLSVLRRNGTISTWNCRKLLPGDKWDGMIKKELEEADVIIFLVSDDFLATDYIWDIEIKRAIEREQANPSIRVIPIIVRSCDWQESPLGIYNTAPKKAQIINTSADIDVAWTDVVRELKKILVD